MIRSTITTIQCSTSIERVQLYSVHCTVYAHQHSNAHTNAHRTLTCELCEDGPRMFVCLIYFCFSFITYKNVCTFGVRDLVLHVKVYQRTSASVEYGTWCMNMRRVRHTSTQTNSKWIWNRMKTIRMWMDRGLRTRACMNEKWVKNADGVRYSLFTTTTYFIRFVWLIAISKPKPKAKNVPKTVCFNFIILFGHGISLIVSIHYDCDF